MTMPQSALSALANLTAAEDAGSDTLAGRLAVGIFMAVGMLVSYLPQIAKLVAERTSAGISVLFLACGMIGCVGVFANIVIAQIPSLACCVKAWSPLICFANTLGITQMLVQFACFSIIFGLFYVYYPHDMRYVNVPVQSMPGFASSSDAGVAAGAGGGAKESGVGSSGGGTDRSSEGNGTKPQLKKTAQAGNGKHVESGTNEGTSRGDGTESGGRSADQNYDNNNNNGANGQGSTTSTPSAPINAGNSSSAHLHIQDEEETYRLPSSGASTPDTAISIQRPIRVVSNSTVPQINQPEQQAGSTVNKEQKRRSKEESSSETGSLRRHGSRRGHVHHGQREHDPHLMEESHGFVEDIRSLTTNPTQLDMEIRSDYLDERRLSMRDAENVNETTSLLSASTYSLDSSSGSSTDSEYDNTTSNRNNQDTQFLHNQNRHHHHHHNKSSAWTRVRNLFAFNRSSGNPQQGKKPTDSIPGNASGVEYFRSQPSIEAGSQIVGGSSAFMAPTQLGRGRYVRKNTRTWNQLLIIRNGILFVIFAALVVVTIIVIHQLIGILTTREFVTDPIGECKLVDSGLIKNRPNNPLDVPGKRFAKFIAGLFGMIATGASMVQFLPQLLLTYNTQEVGALSIPTMMIQCPGSFFLALSLSLQPGTNWTTWMTYFIGGLMQGALLVLCICYVIRDRAAESNGKSNDPNDNDNNGSSSPLLGQTISSPGDHQEGDSSAGNGPSSPTRESVQSTGQNEQRANAPAGENNLNSNPNSNGVKVSKVLSSESDLLLSDYQRAASITAGLNPNLAAQSDRPGTRQAPVEDS